VGDGRCRPETGGPDIGARGVLWGIAHPPAGGNLRCNMA